MCTSRVRATVARHQVLAFDQRHTSVETDFRHGLGEIITANVAELPAGVGNLGLRRDDLRADPGGALQLRRRRRRRSSRPTTGSTPAACATSTRPTSARRSELVVDKLAAAMRHGPLRVPAEVPAQRAGAGRASTRSPRSGDWGRADAGGHGAGHRHPQGVQGRAAPAWWRSTAGRRPSDREVRDARHRARASPRSFSPIDVGLAINPRGLEAQMHGRHHGRHRARADLELHLRNGHFLEASWDNYFYTRQWNTPPDVQVVVMPPTTDEPGRRGGGRGGGERWRRWPAPTPGRPARCRRTSRSTTATRSAFEPKPIVPPIPQSPDQRPEPTY